jgi:uncharacterized membrane protein YeaQ/YmgE (transglycosylase-associated protein family)
MPENSSRKESHMIGAIILGIVAGFLGRFLMPGRDKMGFVATTLLGLAGALLGWLLFTHVLGIGDENAFNLGGLLSALIGVVILLGLLRLYRHYDESTHHGLFGR